MFLEDAQILPSSSMVQRPSRQVSSNIDLLRSRFDADVYALNDVPKDKEKES